MTNEGQTGTGKYDAAIKACAINAKRLHKDMQCLFENRRFEAAYHLAILVQEECAKAFILQLINESILPWTVEVARAMKTHECKHLIGIIMVWLSPPTYEEVMARNERTHEEQYAPIDLPPPVADAINVLRHEKIGRWMSKDWWWTEDPDWDPHAKKIGEGSFERQKQRAVYIDVNENGAYQMPQVKERDADVEYHRAEQMLEITDGLVMSYRENLAVREAMKVMFANLFPKPSKEFPR